MKAPWFVASSDGSGPMHDVSSRGSGCVAADAHVADGFASNRPTCRGAEKLRPSSRDCAIQRPCAASMPATYTVPFGATAIVERCGWSAGCATTIGALQVRPASVLRLTTTLARVFERLRVHER